MADENDVIDVPDDTIIDTPADSIDPLEAIALDMGWTPKDKWRGDEAKFKDASDYIRDTAKINSDQSRELKALKETTSRISQVTESLMADKIAERDAYWQNQHREAVEIGDFEAAEKAATERAKVNQPAPIPQEVQDFAQRNATWFQKDPLATKRAIEIAGTYAEAGFSVSDQVARAEAQIRKEFPEHFPQAKPAPQVGAPQSRQAGTSKASAVDQLPPEALAVAKDMQDRLGVPVEAFAEEWVADQGAKK